MVGYTCVVWGQREEKGADSVYLNGPQNGLANTLWAAPKRAQKTSVKTRSRKVWNKLPLLTLAEDGDCGQSLRCLTTIGLTVVTLLRQALGGVTWAHMLGALFHRRMEFLLRPPSGLLTRIVEHEIVQTKTEKMSSTVQTTGFKPERKRRTFVGDKEDTKEKEENRWS